MSLTSHTAAPDSCMLAVRPFKIQYECLGYTMLSKGAYEQLTCRAWSMHCRKAPAAGCSTILCCAGLLMTK